jgi:CHAT domain-containing protein
VIAAATPIADALCELADDEGFDHLVLVPWRGLHCVPWTALSLSDGQLLTQRIRVTHAPAIRMLRRSPGGEPGARSTVAIAAHGGTLARADVEAQIVADITAAAIVADGAPSEEIVRAMSAANVVHIAGHGAPGPSPFAAALLAGKPPLEPSRVLSSARIHAEADLSKCDLVMINTCDSGRYAPMPRAFENHTGLDTACLCAGATVVISTLWPVNDMVATFVAAMTHWNLASGSSPHSSLDSAIAVLRDGHGSSGIPEGLRSSLDARLGADWRDQLDGGMAVLRHPYWWAAWRISGSDWLLE